MLTLVTGTPGAGKSVYSVKLLFEYVETNKQIAAMDDEKREEKGLYVRDIFCDIAGFDHEKYGTKESPEDWTTAPVGSVIFYDECQERFGPDKSAGRSAREDIRALERHRHKGVDIFFITQRETLLHSHVRDLVGIHYHLQNINGAAVANVFKKVGGVISTKSVSALKQCESTTWQYPKKLFSAYKSTELNTHKFVMPKWLKMGIFLLIVSIAMMVFAGSYAIDFFTGETLKSVIIDEPESSGSSDSFDSSGSDYSSSNTFQSPDLPLKPAYQGCVVWSARTRCRCYHNDGSVADLMLSQCLFETEKPNAIFAYNDRSKSETETGSSASERGVRNDKIFTD